MTKKTMRRKGKMTIRRKGKMTMRRKNKTQKQQFLYNPNNPKKSFDVYIDKNPDDTIHIKYTTVDDVKQTIQKLERLYKQRKYRQINIQLTTNFT